MIYSINEPTKRFNEPNRAFFNEYKRDSKLRALDYHEIQSYISGIRLDVDLYQNTPFRLIKDKHFKLINRAIVRTIKTNLDITESDVFHIMYQLRDNTNAEYNHKLDSYKDGIHIRMPAIQLNKPNKAVFIRLLNEELEGLFDDIGYINKKLTINVIDLRAVHNPVCLIESTKLSASSHYKVHSVYRYNGNKCIKMRDSIICKYNLPLEFSINPYGFEILTNKIKEYRLIQSIDRITAPPLILTDQDKALKEHPNVVISILRLILKHLPKQYYINSSKWRMVLGGCTNSISIYELSRDIVLNMVNEWSKQVLNTQWPGLYKGINDVAKNMFNNNINLKGLINLLKTDNRAVYNECYQLYYSINNSDLNQPKAVNTDSIEQILLNNAIRSKPIKFKLRETDTYHEYVPADGYLIPYDISDGNFTVIRSAMGSGKTYQIVHYLMNNPDLKVCYISTRRSFTGDISNKLEALGFISYLDIKDTYRISSPKIIIQMESLKRLNIKAGYDLLILDECITIQKQFFSPTMRDKLMITWKKFQYLLKHTNKILCLDANINNEFINYLQLYNKPICMTNCITKHKDSKMLFNVGRLTDSNPVMNKLFEELGLNKRVVVVNNYGVKFNEALKLTILNRYPHLRVKTYNNMITRKSDNIIEEYQNINTIWLNYDVIIYNPSIGPGVDFHQRNHFDACFGFFNNQTTSVEYSRQMLKRVRYLKEKRYYVNLEYIHVNNSLFKPNTKTELIEFIHSREVNLIQDIKQYGVIPGFDYDPEGNEIFNKDEYYQTWINNIVAGIISKRRFSSMFLKQEHQTGVTLMIMKDAATNDDVTKNLMNHKGILQDTEYHNIANAYDIDHEEYLHLKRLSSAEKLSELQYYQLKRYRLKRLYRYDQNITPEFVKTYDKPKVKSKWLILNELTKASDFNGVIKNLTAKLNDNIHYNEPKVINELTVDILDDHELNELCRINESKDINLSLNKVYSSNIEPLKVAFKYLDMLGFSKLLDTNNDILNYDLKVNVDVVRQGVNNIYKRWIDDIKLYNSDRELFGLRTRIRADGKHADVSNWSVDKIAVNTVRTINNMISSVVPIKIRKAKQRAYYSVKQVDLFTWNKAEGKPYINTSK